MKKISIFTMTLLIQIASLFCATMDARVRTVPKEATELVFTKPKEGLPLVVKHLTSNGGSSAVKALHDWICDNIAYDSDLYFSGRIAKQDYESVLKKKKAVCSGYTNLMNEMCRLAGIESYGIEGYSKGFGYNGKIGNRPDHAWNVVKMNAKWQLIDVTWDAGYLDYKTFIKHYSTEWLYRTPEQFIYSHLPVKDEYQYLSKPKTAEEFVKEPYIPGIFFEYGLTLGKVAPDYTNEISEAVNYDFKLTKTGIAIGAQLEGSGANKTGVQNAVWVDRIGSRIAVDVNTPTADTYRVYISARNRASFLIPRHFEVSEFEGRILPQAQQLVTEKKITQKEFELLQSAYFKVDENHRYYIAEDLFATTRNAATEKILKLIYKGMSFSENVMFFDVKAADGYSGFGKDIVRFPSEYSSYMETANTHLVSPAAGILARGTTQKFEVESKDYVGIALSFGENLIPLTKDAKTGIFSLETEIPPDAEQAVIFGSKNGKNYAGLWFYSVE